MYLEPQDQSTRDFIVNGERQVHFCSRCGHSLTMHGPADETDSLPCKELKCECTGYEE